MERTHIIILNWNGGKDTWKCVRSVCELPGVNITVLDNASSDDSVLHILQGLEEMNRASVVVDADQAAPKIEADAIRIILSGENLGFARGINLVLRLLLRSNDDSYVWLLNNDAIAAPDALTNLISAMQGDAHVGFAGSLIMDATKPDEIQCLGVRYYKWLGVGKMLFKGRLLSAVTDQMINGEPADFQHGASLLVRMDMIRQTGLLDDRFFLYSEEHDWQTRAASDSWKNVRVPASKVFHLGSMSTERTKHLFYYHYCRSSVIYSRKHSNGITAIIASAMLTLITLVRTRLVAKSFYWGLKGIKEAWNTRL